MSEDLRYFDQQLVVSVQPFHKAWQNLGLVLHVWAKAGGSISQSASRVGKRRSARRAAGQRLMAGDEVAASCACILLLNSDGDLA